MRSPLIVRFPDPTRRSGNGTRRVTSALVESIDVYPSLCEYCGLSPPNHVEGISLLNMAQGKSIKGKQAAYSQINPVGKPKRHLMAYSVRTQNFRYVQWRDRNNGYKIVSQELYEHKNDPLETRSVAENRGYEAILQKHARLVEHGYPSLKSIQQ